MVGIRIGGTKLDAIVQVRELSGVSSLRLLRFLDSGLHLGTSIHRPQTSSTELVPIGWSNSSVDMLTTLWDQFPHRSPARLSQISQTGHKTWESTYDQFFLGGRISGLRPIDADDDPLGNLHFIARRTGSPATLMISVGQDRRIRWSVWTESSTSNWASHRILSDGFGQLRVIEIRSSWMRMTRFSNLAASSSTTLQLTDTNTIHSIRLIDPVRNSGQRLQVSTTGSGFSAPASILANRGATELALPIRKLGIGSGTLTLRWGGAIQTLSVRSVPSLRSLTVERTTLASDQTTRATIELANNSPTGGTTVTLQSSSTLIAPLTVIVPAGQRSVRIEVRAKTITRETTGTLISKLGSQTRTQTMRLIPVGIDHFEIAPATVVGGAVATATIKLNGVAPSGGIRIAIEDEPFARGPQEGYIEVLAGQREVTFPIRTTAPPFTQLECTIVAKYRGETRRASLIVKR
jgi:hypothetical protein